jgi:Leucine-rich repeat (LRR) protein
MARHIKIKKILANEKCCLENIEGIKFLKDYDRTITITNYYGKKISPILSKKLPAVLLDNNSVMSIKDFIRMLKEKLYVLSENNEQIVYDAGHRVIVENKPI